MTANHPIKVKKTIFLPAQLHQENNALVDALARAKELKETQDMAHYGTTCLCTPQGVPLVIRRLGENNDLFLARWPNTEQDHAEACYFRDTKKAIKIRSRHNRPATADADLVNWDFSHSRKGKVIHDGKRTPVYGTRSPSGPGRDTLVDLLHRLWKVAGLSIQTENNPKDWFNTVLCLLPATRHVRFGQNYPLNEYLRIWAKPGQRAAENFNATLDTSEDFLALGEVYSLSREQYKIYLPFSYFTKDLTVRIDENVVSDAVKDDATLKQLVQNKDNKVIGLAHVTMVNGRHQAVALALIPVDRRYMPL